MNTTRIGSIFIVGLLTLCGGTAMAAPTAKTATATAVKVRQVSQGHRVLAGVAKGQVTRGEAISLALQQRRINRTRNRMVRNDGRLGAYERGVLRRKQNRASAHIWRARHNRRTR